MTKKKPIIPTTKNHRCGGRRRLLLFVVRLVLLRWALLLLIVIYPSNQTSNTMNSRQMRKTVWIRRVIVRLLRLLVVFQLFAFGHHRQQVLADFIVDLEEDEKECFHIRVSATGSILSGDFDCWEESEDHMRPCPRFSAWIDEDPPSPNKRVNPTVWKVGEDYDFSIDVHTNSQRYRLCFLATSKEKHQLTTQQRASARKVVEEEEEKGGGSEQDAFFNGDYKITVGFNIRVHDPLRTLPVEEIGPDALRAITLQKSALHVTDQWQTMHDHFSYMHFREAEHRRMSEQINDRVMGWTILESLLVVTMAIGQVMYWRSFFEQRRFL